MLCLKLKKMGPDIRVSSLPRFIQYAISLSNYLRIHKPFVNPQLSFSLNLYS